jgi:hypothetical protein
MKRDKIFLVASILIFTFLLVYTPHYRYSFPSHIDEWHSITEAKMIQAGEFERGMFGFRVGFQMLILMLSQITNITLIYKFLPAMWAVVSALVLFYVVYKKTGDQFHTALFAMIFFASIKSNVNITGLWFFTPLTFSMPFIFLYAYLFTEGLEKQNKKFILFSLAIMVMLLFVHAISVLFAIPFLIIYVLFNLRYIKKEWKFFSLFLSIPIIGSVFYKFMGELSWKHLIRKLIQALQFEYGWGVLELDNSFLELYSFAGYALAIIGLIVIIRSKNLKKYLAYALWPVTVLISIIIFRITDVSYLSPYQRNLYYFAISLPMFSALGLDYVLRATAPSLKKAGTVAVFIIIIFFTFLFYWDIPEQIDLYKVIKDDDERRALLFLSTIPEKKVVMAKPRISTAIYPISQHEPVATYFFYGERPDAERFFRTGNCVIKEDILNKYNVKYVLSKNRINCGWKLIYDKGYYIYEID